jgi:hypothetical protein
LPVDVFAVLQVVQMLWLVQARQPTPHAVQLELVLLTNVPLGHEF